MTGLVADVGGTNTRLALVDDARAIGPSARFANDEFGSFGSVLRAFARQKSLPVLDGVCIAVAGPVTSETARLTNRNWHFDKVEIAGLLPGLVPESVLLINDLAALGYALPALTGAQLVEIKPTTSDAEGNGQALVLGLGTGVNVCLGKSTRKAHVVIEAELGHVSLPNSVLEPLRAAIGSESAAFPSVEELFAGRGLSLLYQILSEGEQRAGQDILADYDAGVGGAVAETVDLMAGLLGHMARELVYMYQPFGGIHFAGGVARGILGSAARKLFLHRFETPGRFAEHASRVPIRLIIDDAAALTGAAQVIAEIPDVS
ncbi:glucokinase [Sedimentitalea todarodis]|uniref:ROK family protein n=1 Tax=Sedimentitalea todarodis TaxID=1631240 RepID=A0ABU3VFV8_9RHOB|nr:ROK family protein [Sedimentitalea todarodis]MDU9005072.1 ROK family protein [Sedimentitalea todarodis]